jgi:hypothetical protein
MLEKTSQQCKLPAINYVGMFMHVNILTSHLLVHFSGLQVPSIQAAVEKQTSCLLFGLKQLENGIMSMLQVLNKSNRSSSRLRGQKSMVLNA